MHIDLSSSRKNCVRGSGGGAWGKSFYAKTPIGVRAVWDRRWPEGTRGQEINRKRKNGRNEITLKGTRGQEELSLPRYAYFPRDEMRKGY